jgi:hypothetical protein
MFENEPGVIYGQGAEEGRLKETRAKLRASWSKSVSVPLERRSAGGNA